VVHLAAARVRGRPHNRSREALAEDLAQRAQARRDRGAAAGRGGQRRAVRHAGRGAGPCQPRAQLARLEMTITKKKKKYLIFA